MFEHKKFEDIPLEELEKKLHEYRSNLSQIEAILDREKNSHPSVKLEDLKKTQTELRQSITYQEDLIRFKIQTSDTIFSTTPLLKTSIGKVCAAYFEQEKKWINSIINDVNENEQTADITYIGYKEKEVLPAKFIKLHIPPKLEDIEVGIHCEAIYYEDGMWYPCVIEQISEHGLHIRYKKYNDKEVVSFDSVRITPEQKLINEKKKKEFLKKRQPDNELEFSIPDNLKINPSDSEAQRQMKKKKIKALKNNFKQKQIEKDTKEKQDIWLNFNQKNSKLKSGFFAHKKPDSIFKAPVILENKVGLINVGRGTGEFNKKI